MSQVRHCFLSMCLAVISQLLSVVTALAAGPSFNCTSSSTQVEKMICADPRLSRTDLEMAKDYKYGLAYASPDVRQELQKEQTAWIKSRNSCTTLRCLSDSYEVRLMRLRSVTAAIDGD
jgi:uncharacterized protein